LGEETGGGVWVCNDSTNKPIASDEIDVVTRHPLKTA
jgi:hypothetical protein